MIRGNVELTEADLSQVFSNRQMVILMRLMQEQLKSQVESIRYDDLSDTSVLPDIPASGYGMLYTPWGVYSASDGGVWLRLHTGVTYAPGDAMPVVI